RPARPGPAALRPRRSCAGTTAGWSSRASARPSPWPHRPPRRIIATVRPVHLQSISRDFHAGSCGVSRGCVILRSAPSARTFGRRDINGQLMFRLAIFVHITSSIFVYEFRRRPVFVVLPRCRLVRPRCCAFDSIFCHVFLLCTFYFRQLGKRGKCIWNVPCVFFHAACFFTQALKSVQLMSYT
ncbi:DNA-binding protein RFX6, partial [Frankliniella fusca]